MPPQFTTLTARAIVLPHADIDTDQIIPARFLKVTDRQGLAEGLFHAWRRNADGTPRAEFPLNRPEAAGAEILVAGPNFGCGSSREHAPWALLGGGFRAVISPYFADIFRGNALKNGLVPAAIAPEAHAALAAALEQDPALPVTVDLQAGVVRWPGGPNAPFATDPFARDCLLRGVDELGWLLALHPEITAYEHAHAA